MLFRSLKFVDLEGTEDERPRERIQREPRLAVVDTPSGIASPHWLNVKVVFDRHGQPRSISHVVNIEVTLQDGIIVLVSVRHRSISALLPHSAASILFFPRRASFLAITGFKNCPV